jgi:hypothetical protein
MVKDYHQWLNERSMQTPIAVEIEAGKVKVFADPQEENWMGETVRQDIYEELKAKVKKAVKDGDDTQLRDLLKTVRELPLFGNDKSNVWKQGQIDGVEMFRSGTQYREWLAKYVIRKIELFLEWARNQGNK